MHRILVLLASLTSLLLSSVPVIAFMSYTPVLNPKNYESPSGEFVLNVDPTDLYGRGEGNYRVTKNGVLVWSGTKPFTLYDAGITDKGLVGGYAYINGRV